VARNRKRAKERQARRRQPVGTAPVERDEPPAPTRHAAPDVELAEAQLALGRPELVDEPHGEPDSEPEAEYDDYEDEQAFEAEEDAVDQAELEDGRDGGGGPRAIERASDGGGEGAAAHPVHKPNLITRLIHFFEGCWRELQRVQWPDRRQVVQATGVVIGFVIVAGIYLGLADELASKLVTFVLK
jgi:preprotein translocase SecE subunit